MRIEKLTLKHYRGFSDLTIQFPKSGPAVFIGWNGAGKSSVLDALAYLIRTLHFERFHLPHHYNNLSELDIEFGESRAIIQLHFEEAGKTGWIQVGKLATGPQVKEFSDNFALDEILTERLDELVACSMPIFVFYDAERKVAAVEEESEVKRYLIPQLKAFEGSFGKKMQFDHFVRWFVEEENKENREKIRLKDFEYTNTGLNAVRNAWHSFFEVIGERQYKNLRVEERKFNQYTSIPSSLVITKDGNDLNLRQLSDGERLSLGMVADIAHRLVIANPKLEDPLQGQGVVLIDEVELHLHPAWQRRIVPALEKTFPGIQFIMTTHSPQVLSRVGREQVFVLERFEVVEAPFTFGRDANTLLEDAFDVPERPEEAKEEFRKLYDLMDDASKQKETEQMLKEVAVKYGDDDPEVLRANMHFTFMKA